MTDREDRQHVIEVLKSWDGYFIGYTSDEVQEALRYAIASIKTDLKYDLLYEEASGQADKQADKPTTKNDVPDNNVGNIYTCSCGYGWDKTKVVRHHFCPNCGKVVEPTTKENLAVDAISRADVLKLMQDNWHTHNGDWAMQESMDDIRALPSVTPQEPRCKDCKWWKDSDGKYRRGCGAESICRINTDKVYQGEGYCYMFESQKSEG